MGPGAVRPGPLSLSEARAARGRAQKLGPGVAGIQVHGGQPPAVRVGTGSSTGTRGPERQWDLSGQPAGPGPPSVRDTKRKGNKKSMPTHRSQAASLQTREFLLNSANWRSSSSSWCEFQGNMTSWRDLHLAQTSFARPLPTRDPCQLVKKTSAIAKSLDRARGSVE